MISISTKFNKDVALLSLIAIVLQSSSFVFVWLCKCLKVLVMIVVIVPRANQTAASTLITVK